MEALSSTTGAATTAVANAVEVILAPGAGRFSLMLSGGLFKVTHYPTPSISQKNSLKHILTWAGPAGGILGPFHRQSRHLKNLSHSW